MRTPPLVVVAVDAATIEGRNILTGITRFTGAHRLWTLHVNLRATPESVIGIPAADGAILATHSRSLHQQLRELTRNIIACNLSPLSAPPHLSIDAAAIARLAADHFADCHIAHLAYYGRPANPCSTRRLEAFRAYPAQISVEESPVFAPMAHEVPTQTHWPRLTQWLLALPKPVGILATDDAAAHDLAAACHHACIPVPDHVAILGINNDPLLCETAATPLSSIEIDYERLGYLAAEMLDIRLKSANAASDEPSLMLAPVGIIRRASTDFLAIGDPHIAQVVRFIRDRACDPCTVADVLQHVPVGRRWLERQFTQKLGRTPHDEIIRVRMDFAKRLLVNSGESLLTIANRCGFTTVQSFARSFRRLVKTTPAAFRRTARKGAS